MQSTGRLTHRNRALIDSSVSVTEAKALMCWTVKAAI